MPPTDAQLPLSFARPRKKKGGLSLQPYRELVERLRADAARVAGQFKLPSYELDADRPDAHDRYGVCYADGRIRVRLVHARTGRPLRYSALIDTVVHELAHLRHMNHGPHWEALYEKMLAWCRTQGIYAPQQRREPPARPVQLGLFGREGRRLDVSITGALSVSAEPMAWASASVGVTPPDAKPGCSACPGS